MVQERENFKAGLFVLAGIVLALAVVFTLSDFQRIFEKRQQITISYSLADGVQGLKAGATVTLGDQPVGEVLRIEDTRDAIDRVVGKKVTISIPSRYQLFQNAVVELNVPPLGSGTKLNIRSVGNDKPYDGKTPIAGGVAGSPLTKNLVAEAGIGDLQRQQVQHIIANVESITATLRDDTPKISKSVQETLDKAKPVLDDARAAIADAKAVVADVRQRSTAWFDRIDTITASADASLKRVDALLKDKDPDLRKTVENVRDISQQAKDQTMAQITEALSKADAALGSAKKAAEELQALAVGQRPVLERMLANFQLSSDQLKLASIEVRRSPWRLLYKPGDEELTSDNLYDAARSFALAAGTLDAASRSLAAVTQQNPRDHEQVKKMLDHLEVLFKRYSEAEDSFWKALKSPPSQ